MVHLIQTTNIYVTLYPQTNLSKIVPALPYIILIITEDGGNDKFSGEVMHIIYQASDEDFNFFKTQGMELKA